MRKLVVVLALAASCSRRPVAPPPAPPEFHRSENLLALVNGASVVSRTGEALITTTPVRAIDGNPATRWLSPPRDIRQFLVFSLPARARITAVGAHTGSKEGRSTGTFEVELSEDGVQFVSAGQFTIPKEKSAARFDVKPAVARYVRFTPHTSAGAFSTFGEVELRGAFLGPLAAGPLDGCWSIDGMAASFQHDGASAAGHLGGDRNLMLDGGLTGALYRFAWIRGPEYGLAAITVAPDGRTLSGMVWHEQAISMDKFIAPDWIGERSGATAEKSAQAGCGGPVEGAAVFRTYLDRFGYYPLYGLRFDAAGNLDRAASAPTLARVTTMLAANRGRNVRFIAHELLQPTPQADRAVTQRETDSLRAALAQSGADLARVAFVSAGDEKARREATTDLTRAMYSGVELEVAR